MGKYDSYPEYKRVHIGLLGSVPSSWDFKRLKYITSINDDVLPESTPPDSEFSYVDIGSVSVDKGIVRTESMKFENAPSRARRRVKIGDVIVSTVRTYLKAIAAINQDADSLVVSTGFCVIRPRQGIVPAYCGYLMQAPFMVEQIVSESVGVSYPAINASQIANMAVPQPTAEEQIQIATFLDRETAKIDQLIEKQQRLIELLEEKRQTVISHAVTKGLNPDAPMKDSGVEWPGEVPTHWDVVPLKYLCNFSGGGTPSKENIEYWNGDIPWVSPKDMKTAEINDSKDKITKLALNESSTSLVKAGAVLIVVRSGILQHSIPVAINRVSVALNQDMKALRFTRKLLAEFMINVIRGNQSSLLMAWGKQGATVESIEQEYLANTPIPVPPISEQNQIIDELARLCLQIDQLTSKAKQAINLMKERRTALISAAVTGKIDVRDQVPQDVEEVVAS